MKTFSFKKFSACFMVMLVLLASLSVCFASAAIEGNYQYEIVETYDSDMTYLETYAIIIKYNGSESVVNIPSALGGHPVKGIEYSAFRGNHSVTSVTIPEGVRSLGDEVFAGCTKLTQLNLPSTLNSIGYDILMNTPICENGEYWDGNLLYIGKYLLDYDNSSENTHIAVKEGTELISNMTFAFSDITSVSLPSSLKIVGKSAFIECKKITSITLPQGLEYLGGWAFDSSGIESITVPDSVTIIGDGCFAGCKNLTSVTLPNNIGRINAGMFENCTSLKNFNIPASVTLIGFNAFANTGLTSINIPEKVKEIWDNAFAGCKNLTEISVAFNNQNFYSEDGVLYEKFMTLYTLRVYPAGKTDESYTFPGEVKYSGLYAFDSVQHLKTIKLHANSQDAKFWNAYSVENVFVSDANKDFYDIDGVVFKTTNKALHFYPAGKNLSSYTTPAGCTVVETSSISDNPYLTSVTISEGVEAVEYCAINKCNNLKTVNLPSTLTYLSIYEPVSDCDSIETINYANTKAMWDSFDTDIHTNSTKGLYLNTIDGTYELVAPYEEETDFSYTTEPASSQPVIESSATTEPVETSTETSASTEPAESAPVVTTPSENNTTNIPEEKFEVGDVNMDDKINIRDVTSIQKYLAKLLSLDETALKLADFTQDNKVNIKDATTIQKKIAGLI